MDVESAEASSMVSLFHWPANVVLPVQMFLFVSRNENRTVPSPNYSFISHLVLLDVDGAVCMFVDLPFSVNAGAVAPFNVDD